MSALIVIAAIVLSAFASLVVWLIYVEGRPICNYCNEDGDDCPRCGYRKPSADGVTG